MSRFPLIEQYVTGKYLGTVVRESSVDELFVRAEEETSDGNTVLILTDEPVAYVVPQEIDGVNLLVTYVYAMQTLYDPNIHIHMVSMEGRPVLVVDKRAIL